MDGYFLFEEELQRDTTRSVETRLRQRRDAPEGKCPSTGELSEQGRVLGSSPARARGAAAEHVREASP
jgi:hypothetical protein